jgi:hypothetical protein
MKRGIYYHAYFIWHFHFLCFEIDCAGAVPVIPRIRQLHFPAYCSYQQTLGLLRFLGGQCSAGIPIVLPVTTVQLLDSMKLESVKSISLQESV